jgi:hypothetical protein
VCNCELCTLPDSLSNTLDAKIKTATEARDYVTDFLKRQLELQVNVSRYVGYERDAFRAAQLLDIYMSIIIHERLFFDYSPFYLSLKFFSRVGQKLLLEQVGEAVLCLFRRHLGTGEHQRVGVKHASVFLEEALSSIGRDSIRTLGNQLASIGSDSLDAQLQSTAANIIFNLQSLQ